MQKAQIYAKIVLITFILLTSFTTSSGNCQAVIKDAINHLQSSTYSRLDFSISQLKAPAKFVAFASSQFVLKKSPIFVSPQIGFSKSIRQVSDSTSSLFLFKPSYLQAKDVKTYFSDRSYCAEQSSGGPFKFCTVYQYFDHDKPDISQINLFRNSTLQLILTTWGNTKYTVELQCRDEFIIGILSEGNEKSLLAISLRKTSLPIIK